MTTCTEVDFQKLKAKLVANGDLPAGTVIKAAANKAASLQVSIDKAVTAAMTSPALATAITPKPAAKVLTAFQRTVARVKAQHAAKASNRSQPVLAVAQPVQSQPHDFATRAKGRI